MSVEISRVSGIAPERPTFSTGLAVSARTSPRAWTTVTSPPTAEPASFDSVVQKTTDEYRSRPPFAAGSRSVATPATQKLAGKTQRAFEAVTLQVFVGSMLPNESSKLFGTGPAGKMWKSLLAEKIADSIAASGRLRLLPESAFGAAAKNSPSWPRMANAGLSANSRFEQPGSLRPWSVAVESLPAEDAGKAALNTEPTKEGGRE